MIWYLDHGFLTIKQWRLDIQCLQLVNAKFEASYWPEQNIIGNSLQFWGLLFCKNVSDGTLKTEQMLKIEVTIVGLQSWTSS